VKVVWDHEKNLANQQKHGIRFEEASELFRSGVDYLRFLTTNTLPPRIVSLRSVRFDAGSS
jgi:uncharacterized DUF497 family protein